MKTFYYKWFNSAGVNIVAIKAKNIEKSKTIFDEYFEKNDINNVDHDQIYVIDNIEKNKAIYLNTTHSQTFPIIKK